MVYVVSVVAVDVNMRMVLVTEVVSCVVPTDGSGCKFCYVPGLAWTVAIGCCALLLSPELAETSGLMLISYWSVLVW